MRTMKACYYCGELVGNRALKCAACGESLLFSPAAGRVTVAAEQTDVSALLPPEALDDFTVSYLGGAELRGIFLDGADLFEENLVGSDLRGADFSGATYDRSTIWPRGFDPETAGAIRIG